MCSKGSAYNRTYIKSENPIISAVIPAYNCEKTIERTIRSIQYQNMLDLEIIVVNDFSSDSTFTKVKNLQLKDPRIKILNNTKNMGTFYSRCVGFLESTGKYVLEIDNDDLFSESDVFDTLYEQTEEESFDIISFLALAVYYSSQFEDDTLTFIPNKTTNIVLYQSWVSILIKNLILFMEIKL